MELTRDVAFEMIARSAVKLLYDRINDEIDDQNTKWASGADALYDSAFWASIGQDPRSIVIENIEAQNFFVGHVPSLINGPVEKYPNIAVHVSQGNASGGNEDDWAEAFVVVLWVEVMVKSLVDEEEVNSRLIRTVEAAHRCFMDDNPVSMSGSARKLRSLVPTIHNTPNVTIGDVFIKREGSGHGNKFFWQGARLEYICEKLSPYGGS